MLSNGQHFIIRCLSLFRPANHFLYFPFLFSGKCSPSGTSTQMQGLLANHGKSWLADCINFVSLWSLTYGGFFPCARQSLVITKEFQHILRILNTNISGTRNVQYALTSVKGVGRRFANIICKKADIPITKRQVPISFISYYPIV